MSSSACSRTTSTSANALEALESQLAGYKRMEATLQKTLVSAQASADELKLNSGKEAELILHEAELKGRQLVNEAYSERQSHRAVLGQAQERRSRTSASSSVSCCEDYLRYLDEAEPGVAAVPPDGVAQAEFARHAEAIKEAIAREEAAPAAESPEALTPTAEPSAAPDVTAEVPAADVAEADVADADVADAEFTDEAPPEYSIDAAPRPAPDLPTQPGPGAAEPPPARERILFGETDDLLADVDSGVNENEFKW